MTYTIEREPSRSALNDLMPLFLAHHEEMADNLAEIGIPVFAFNPDVERYAYAEECGLFACYVVRFNGDAVGYMNVKIGADTRTGVMMAQEDALYITPDHRRGIGLKLVRHVIEELKHLGVKRLFVSSVTDPRADKLWKRIGFKPMAMQMAYDMEGA